MDVTQSGTLAPTAPYEGAMVGRRLAVLDVETTGGDPLRARIMEVAVITVETDGRREHWSSLVDPGIPVPPFASGITGITDPMLKGAPSFTEVMPELLRLTEDAVVVAHNARFDMTALVKEFSRFDGTFERETICTERLSRSALPQLSHHNLGSLCRFFGIAHPGRHRAANDAAATLALLEQLAHHGGVQRLAMSIMPPFVALRA